MATRSPFRPNNLGRSSVKILGVEHTPNYGTVIHVSGADLMDGTPIFDIKPYIPYSDSHPDASGGFTDKAGSYILEVEVSDEQLALIPENKREALLGVLSHDPRPSYKQDSQREYGLSFADMNIRFTVTDGKLIVQSISKI